MRHCDHQVASGLEGLVTRSDPNVSVVVAHGFALRIGTIRCGDEQPGFGIDRADKVCVVVAVRGDELLHLVGRRYRPEIDVIVGVGFPIGTVIKSNGFELDVPFGMGRTTQVGDRRGRRYLQEVDVIVDSVSSGKARSPY